MSNTAYTENEIKDILHALFYEKKRVKELEHKLGGLILSHSEKEKQLGEDESNPHNIEEISKLRILALELKRKYAQSLNEIQLLKEAHSKPLLREAEVSGDYSIAEVDSLQQQIASLKQIISGKEEEASKNQETISSLQTQLTALQELFEQKGNRLIDDQLKVESLKKDNDLKNAEISENLQHSQQLERVIQFLRERMSEAKLELEQVQKEFQASQEAIKIIARDYRLEQEKNLVLSEKLAQEVYNKNELLLDLEAIQSQFESLKNSVYETEILLTQKNNDLQNSWQECENLKSCKNHFENLCNEKNSELENFKNEYRNLQITCQENLQHHKNAEAEIFTHKEQLKVLLDNELKLRNEIIALENQVKQGFQIEIELNETKKINSEKDCQLEELQKHLEDIIEKKEKIEESYNQNLAQFQDRELRIKVAQQHLAKKVKETSVLTEQLDDARVQNSEMQNSLSQSQMKISEVQNSLELQIQHEKRLQEQLHNTIKFSEGQVAKWEEKYFRIYEKWQESEMRIKELKIIEDKHNHMQTLLVNLGSVFTPAPGTTTSGTNTIPGMPMQIIDTQKLLNTKEKFDEILPKKMDSFDDKNMNSQKSESKYNDSPSPTSLFETSPPLQKMRETFFD